VSTPTGRAMFLTWLSHAMSSKEEIELVAHLVAHDTADNISRRVPPTFEPARDIGRRRLKFLVSNDYVAAVNPRRNSMALFRRDGPRCARPIWPLHIDCAAHRIDNTGQLDAQPCAGWS